MTLKSGSLLLRPVQREDLPRLYALEQHVELVLLADGHWQPQAFATFEKKYELQCAAEEQTHFVIEVAGVVVGGIGLHHLNRREGTAELGIGIYDPAYLGQGHGRAAIALLLDWAFRTDTWRRISLSVDAVNERAIRAYRASGFVEEGRLRKHTYQNGAYCDVVLMGMLREEWAALQRSK